MVRDSRALIALSQEPEASMSREQNDDEAVPRLSAGGIITLERTLIRLQTFLDTAATTGEP